MKTQLNIWLILSGALFIACVGFIIASYIVEYNLQY